MIETTARPARKQSHLRLRRPAEIALAFVFGPAAGLTVLFVLMLIVLMVEPYPRFKVEQIARIELAYFYAYLLIAGGFVCLVVELTVITPLLVGFHYHRWTWLNGWTGALIGFALASVPTLLLMPQPSPHTSLNASAWLARIGFAAAIGVVGLVAAGVFRLLAVRRDDGEGAA